MTGKLSNGMWAVLTAAVLILTVSAVSETAAYRICTFKGIVVDDGWRSMVVKSSGRCSTVNVSWRTKFIPNRRPCIGESVAVDFVLEDGYMKATKVVSLTKLPPPVSCYPPPPPSNAVCRDVPDAAPDSCPPPKEICSRTPPPHVRDRELKREKKRSKRIERKPERRPGRPERTARKPRPTEKPDTPSGPVEKVADKKTLKGEVIASSPQSLTVQVAGEGGTTELVTVKVGLRTKFMPFRRPAVGENVWIEYSQENSHKFGDTVKVVQ